MRPHLLMAVLGFASCVYSADPVREVFYRGAVTPVYGRIGFDRNHLFYIQPTKRLIMWGPGGYRLYDIDIRAPGQEDVSVAGVAVDSDGTAVVAVGYGPPRAVRGALVFLSATGEQTRFLDVYPYFYSVVTYSEAHFIWAYGGPRVSSGGLNDYPKDPRWLHKYTSDGRELAAFLPFGSLPPSFTATSIRLATDRIGVFGTSRAAGRMAWTLLETDIQGQPFSRLILGDDPGRGSAYTDHAGVYALKQLDTKQKYVRLMLFDRDSLSWKAADEEKYGLDQRLLGANKDEIVIWDRSVDPTLKWFPAPQ